MIKKLWIGFGVLILILGTGLSGFAQEETQASPQEKNKELPQLFLRSSRVKQAAQYFSVIAENALTSKGVLSHMPSEDIPEYLILTGRYRPLKDLGFDFLDDLKDFSEFQTLSSHQFAEWFWIPILWDVYMVRKNRVSGDALVKVVQERLTKVLFNYERTKTPPPERLDNVTYKKHVNSWRPIGRNENGTWAIFSKEVVFCSYIDLIFDTQGARSKLLIAILDGTYIFENYFSILKAEYFRIRIHAGAVEEVMNHFTEEKDREEIFKRMEADPDLSRRIKSEDVCVDIVNRGGLSPSFSIALRKVLKKLSELKLYKKPDPSSLEGRVLKAIADFMNINRMRISENDHRILDSITDFIQNHYSTTYKVAPDLFSAFQAFMREKRRDRGYDGYIDFVYFLDRARQPIAEGDRIQRDIEDGRLRMEAQFKGIAGAEKDFYDTVIYKLCPYVFDNPNPPQNLVTFFNEILVFHLQKYDLDAQVIEIVREALASSKAAEEKTREGKELGENKSILNQIEKKALEILVSALDGMESARDTDIEPIGHTERKVVIESILRKSLGMKEGTPEYDELARSLETKVDKARATGQNPLDLIENDPRKDMKDAKKGK